MEQAEKCRGPEEETQEVIRFIVPLKSGNADGGKGSGQSRPLRRSYTQLSGKAAVGSDGISKAHYGAALESNINDLVQRLKRMGYRPSPVKEVMIPIDGKAKVYRPLGLSNFEDKNVQKRFQEILSRLQFIPLFMLVAMVVAIHDVLNICDMFYISWCLASSEYS